MPYYAATGGDPAALLLGILSIVVLLIVSGILINLKIKEFKIQVILYIMVLLQIGIAIVDNYIRAFPLMEYDARAFEGLAWISYTNNINIGRGAYSSYILNPIYKLLGVRVAMIFEVLNIFFNVLININIYQSLKKLRIEKKLIYTLMIISALSPISLIYRTGVLREATIIMFISFSLKDFIYYCVDKENFNMIKAFIWIGIAAIFHSGAIFIVSGYLLALSGGKKQQKLYQFLILVIGIIGFVLFKDILLEKVGGGDVEAIIRANNYTSLKMASSGYLQSVTTDSLAEIAIYLPLFIFYFLYSPTPDMFRGGLDIISFALNSGIFIYFTFGGIHFWRKIKQNLPKYEKKIILCLFVSVIFTVAVFSIGTRNAGTAIRHRDKVVPLLVVAFAIVKNRYILMRERKKYERAN